MTDSGTYMDGESSHVNGSPYGRAPDLGLNFPSSIRSMGNKGLKGIVQILQ